VSSVGRRERKKIESRSRILDCAAALFSAHGYDATTMEDIGDCADVSRATVFNYFPRKEDLVLAWFDDRRTEIAAVLGGDDDVPGDTTTRLRAAFRALARIFEDDPQTGRGMVRAWLQAGGPLLTPDSDTARLFAATLRAGQRNGEVAADTDPDHAGHVLFDAYQGELVRWATARRKRSDLEQRLMATVELILVGVSAPTPRRRDDPQQRLDHRPRRGSGGRRTSPSAPG
jgi:TetR/AcrR family transcriptional regulator, cholesterol catabolism regulator